MMMKKIPSFLRNKYVLTLIVFLVWIIFFDKNNIIVQHEYQQELDKLISEREYYDSEIKANKLAFMQLNTDTIALEKFAREEFLMKKDNEDVFVIVPEHPEEEKNFKE